MVRRGRINAKVPTFLSTEKSFPLQARVLNFPLPAEFKVHGVDQAVEGRHGVLNENE